MMLEAVRLERDAPAFVAEVDEPGRGADEDPLLRSEAGDAGIEHSRPQRRLERVRRITVRFSRDAPHRPRPRPPSRLRGVQEDFEAHQPLTQRAVRHGERLGERQRNRAIEHGAQRRRADPVRITSGQVAAVNDDPRDRPAMGRSRHRDVDLIRRAQHCEAKTNRRGQMGKDAPQLCRGFKVRRQFGQCVEAATEVSYLSTAQRPSDRVLRAERGQLGPGGPAVHRPQDTCRLVPSAPSRHSRHER
jgi:hypothetical protein